MKRTRYNISGEPMETGTTQQTRNVLRRVRRRASRMGITLAKFCQIYGYESSIGPEWMAVGKWNPELAVKVWRVLGDAEEAEECDEVLVLNTDVYGIS